MPSRKRTAEQAQAQANVLRLMANALRFTGETESAKLKLMEARPIALSPAAWALRVRAPFHPSAQALNLVGFPIGESENLLRLWQRSASSSLRELGRFAGSYVGSKLCARSASSHHHAGAGASRPLVSEAISAGITLVELLVQSEDDGALCGPPRLPIDPVGSAVAAACTRSRRR